MQIKDFTHLTRIKKFLEFLILFCVVIVLKSIWENTFYHGAIEDLKNYFWIGLLLAINSAINVFKVKIVIKNITNDKDKVDAFNWIEQYFVKNKAQLIFETPTEKIYMNETTKGRIFKKKQKDFYFVGLKAKKIVIEGPFSNIASQ